MTERDAFEKRGSSILHLLQLTITNAFTLKKEVSLNSDCVPQISDLFYA